MDVNPTASELHDTELIAFPLKQTKDAIFEIFKKLNLSALGISAQVCKDWKQIATHPTTIKHVIYNDFAFNALDWNKYYNCKVSESEIEEALIELPLNILEILKSPCPAFKGKRILDTHMLVWIPKAFNGQLVTINSFGALLKESEEYKHNERGYHFYWDTIMKQQGDIQAEHGWVLMTTEVLPNSRDMDFESQKILVEKLNKEGEKQWQIPKMTEATLCIYAYIAKTGICNFGKDPWTYTRCQEVVKKGRVFVGAFGEDGIDIHNFNIYADKFLGMAPVRRLKS